MSKIKSVAIGNCTGCEMCRSICPMNAIQMKIDDEGFWKPMINSAKCTECKLCTMRCPVNNVVNKENTHNDLYIAYNSDNGIRNKSSSGGIFYLLAKHCFAKGGVVFGACFDSKFCVKHDVAESMDECLKFMGSKYVQSYIGDSYVQAKKYLSEGRHVLFTGTPCQIAGFRAFLGYKNYDHLICQDFICHGVPSPELWDKYKTYRVRKSKHQIKEINFRSKRYGWKAFNVVFTYADGTEYISPFVKDYYYRAFQANISLCKSCYECMFKGSKSGSDITLADAWGIDIIDEGFADDRGTSAIIVNSDKGWQIYSSIKNNLKEKKYSMDFIMQQNKAYIESPVLHKNRMKFLNEISEDNFNKIVNRYCKENIIFEKIKYKCRRMLQILK